MSKNIAIKEGGLGKLFADNQLKTDLDAGGTCLWVPEDERQLGTKYITKNGTYRASKDGVYGWREVSVSVQASSVTGKDPATGKGTTISVDPETGELEKDIAPYEIRFTTLPTQTVYRDGEAVNLVGAVITAYDSDGEELQTVPLNEVRMDPYVAVYDADPDAQYTLVYEDIPGWPNPFATCSLLQHISVGGFVRSKYEFFCPATACIDADSNNWVGVMAWTERRHACTYTEYDTEGDHTKVIKTEEYYTGKTYTKNGKTVYYAEKTSGNKYEGIPNVGDHSGSIKDVAWALIYGNTEDQDGKMAVTVQWPRPGDGHILETSFAITVSAPGFDGAEGGGGSTSGGGAGRN